MAKTTRANARASGGAASKRANTSATSDGSFANTPQPQAPKIRVRCRWCDVDGARYQRPMSGGPHEARNCDTSLLEDVAAPFEPMRSADHDIDTAAPTLSR